MPQQADQQQLHSVHCAALRAPKKSVDTRATACKRANRGQRTTGTFSFGTSSSHDKTSTFGPAISGAFVSHCMHTPHAQAFVAGDGARARARSATRHLSASALHHFLEVRRGRLHTRSRVHTVPLEQRTILTHAAARVRTQHYSAQCHARAARVGSSRAAAPCQGLLQREAPLALRIGVPAARRAGVRDEHTYDCRARRSL